MPGLVGNGRVAAARIGLRFPQSYLETKFDVWQKQVPDERHLAFSLQSVEALGHSANDADGRPPVQMGARALNLSQTTAMPLRTMAQFTSVPASFQQIAVTRR